MATLCTASLPMLAACVALLMLPAAAQAPVDLRVALVIGNAAYAAAPLTNPANDAKAMGEALKGMGFTVIEARDASKEQMQAALLRAGETLKGRNGIGMLYYAGHGLQLDWHNYMLPVDAKLATAADVPAQAVDLQQVIDAFKAAGNRVNIVVLDACRDNPFGASASAKGLAPMDAPPGTFLAYATAPGNVAEDGDASSGNGLYTQYLVRELKGGDAKIEDMFKRVRLQVRRKSEGRQVPWESTSLEDDFYFDPKAQHARGQAHEQAFAVEKADWDRIKNSTRPDDFYAFLQKYPSGLIGEQAQFRLDQLQKVAVQVQAGANGIRPLAAGADRYAVGDVMRTVRIDGFSKAATPSEMRVTSASRDRVEFNGGAVVIDQMGGVLHNRFGTKDPAVVTAPADIAIGKQWRTLFTNTPAGGSPSTNFWEAKVVALEDVTVPAGTLKAFRVERRGQARQADGRLTQMTGTMWVDPKTMLVVRNDLLFREAGKITEHSSTVLVAFERAPR